MRWDNSQPAKIPVKSLGAHDGRGRIRSRKLRGLGIGLHGWAPNRTHLVIVGIAAAVSMPHWAMGQSDVTFRLARGQTLVYCGPDGRTSLGAGDTAVLGCRNDSLTLNGRTIAVGPFPNAGFCDLTSMKNVFGRVPRIRQLLGESMFASDSSRWYAAVAKYSAEVLALFARDEHGAADSICAGWPHGRPAPGDRPPYPGRPPTSRRAPCARLSFDRWQDLDPRSCHADTIPLAQGRWTYLKGLSIPAIEGYHPCCVDAESLSVRLARIAQSGEPFRAELGCGLVLCGGE